MSLLLKILVLIFSAGLAAATLLLGFLGQDRLLQWINQPVFSSGARQVLSFCAFAFVMIVAGWTGWRRQKR
jgi:hypothetical protein